jgi:hypothetical protein
MLLETKILMDKPWINTYPHISFWKNYNQPFFKKEETTRFDPLPHRVVSHKPPEAGAAALYLKKLQLGSAQFQIDIESSENWRGITKCRVFMLKHSWVRQVVFAVITKFWILFERQT